MRWTSIIVVVLLLIVPFTTRAATRAELLATITQLQQRVIELRKQLAVMRGGSTSPNLTRNLYLGVRGEDVRQLQTYLRTTGDFTYPELTDYYGPATAAAVQRYQCRVMQICSGSPESNGYGVVGPQTRTEITKGIGAVIAGTLSGPTVTPGGTSSSGGGGSGSSSSSKCQFNGSTINSGSLITAYREPIVAHDATCISESRTCSNGTLSGSYNYETCQPTTGYDIIVVAGQSNAVGAGLGEFTDSYENEDVDAKIMQYGRYGVSTNKVVPATWEQDGVVYDALQHWGVNANRKSMGLSIPFARRYIEDGQINSTRQILIIPAAYGGTSILKWLGETNTPVTNPVALYDDMLTRVQKALNLPGDNKVVAVLWHQGEGDINTAAAGFTTMNEQIYRSKMQEIISKLRSDFPTETTFPIIAGTYVPEWASAWQAAEKIFDTKEKFESVVREVLDADVKGGVVDSIGLEANYPSETSNTLDQVHFTSQSLVEFGDRYFELWKTLDSTKAKQKREVHTFSEGFSSSQGEYGWNYQRTANGGYANLSWAPSPWNSDISVWRHDDSYLFISGSVMHPSDMYASVLTWKVPTSGSLSITGSVADSNASCGDGVSLRIARNTVTLWSSVLENAGTSVSHSVDVDVEEGDLVHFEVGARSNAFCDSTRWDPTLTLTSNVE